MKNKTEIPAAEAAHAAKQASFALAAAPGKARSSALLAVAAALHAKANMVFKANEIDMRQAEKEGLAAPALKRLKFDAHKLEDVCAGLEQLAAMEDPIGREQLRTELADGLVLSRVSCPIGVIGVIFESRPDALIQIGGLCLKSGNAVLLKGGREAMRTNEALFDILRDASVATGMPDGWCGLLTTREDVSVMLKMDEDIDLIIPRGSNAFVRYIMENSNIPVLGHSDGVCHVYVDADCDAQMAARIVTDAKTQYPAACNAAEMLLVHSAQLANALPVIARALTEAGVTLRADSRARAALYAAGVASEAGDESDWGREYLALTMAIHTVDSIDEAIAFINKHGSHHTDCIITRDEAAAGKFFALVDSAGVYQNCSTRFAAGWLCSRYKEGLPRRKWEPVFSCVNFLFYQPYTVAANGRQNPLQRFSLYYRILIYTMEQFHKNTPGICVYRAIISILFY